MIVFILVHGTPSLFNGCNVFHLTGIQRFIQPVHDWLTFRLFPVFSFNKQATMNAFLEGNENSTSFCWGVPSSSSLSTLLIQLPMEKAMATHSSTLAWKIPWMEKPGRLQSMGSLRVRHDWATSLSLFTFMHWRRIWQPTPVFLPGESQGRGSLVGCRLWGHTESDTTEAT